MSYYTTTDDRVPACGVSRKWRSPARYERAGRYVFGIDVGVVDHDGEGEFNGGIACWLKLTDGLGLDRDYVTSLRGLLPGTRFVVDAYVHFLREKTLLEPSQSLADIPQCNRHVRFTPESGHSAARLKCPLSANSGHCVTYSITSETHSKSHANLVAFKVGQIE